MGEYSNIYYDILRHPEKYTSVVIEEAHLYYRSYDHREYYPKVAYTYHLSNKKPKHENALHLRQNIKVSDAEYQKMDYDWFKELIRLARSDISDIDLEFQQSTIVIKELISLLTTENEFIALPVRAVWLRRMLRHGSRIGEIWSEVMKSKESYEWFDKTDRQILGFGTITDYMIPLSDNPDFEITDDLSLRDLLRVMVIDILRWNPMTDDFYRREYKAQWKSANILYLGKPTKTLINIYAYIVNIMEGYFFLHFYDLDEDTIESYRKGIKEEIIPAIKTNVKRLMQYMVSLHENEVPNEMHVDLISYGAEVIRQHFYEDFLRMYGKYGIHTLKFDSLDESDNMKPVTITYMFDQEYTDVPIMIDEVSDYFLQYELTTIRNRRQIGRSFNKTLKSVLDNCNRLGKKKNLHFGVVDMPEKEINDRGGFREFLMNGRIDIVEEERENPSIQKNGTTQTSRRPVPSLSWKGVSRSTVEWESVYRNKHDFGDIDGIIPDADSIAINNKYTEQYMDWWDLMNSTATKY